MTTSLPLLPFDNQVGGHASLFRFSKRTICKPVTKKEQLFYEHLEVHQPNLLQYMCQYLGVINVTYRYQRYKPLPEVVFDKNKHLLRDWQACYGREKRRRSSMSDSANSARSFQDQVLHEVFSPKALRERLKWADKWQKRRYSDQHNITVPPPICSTLSSSNPNNNDNNHNHNNHKEKKINHHRQHHFNDDSSNQLLSGSAPVKSHLNDSPTTTTNTTTSQFAIDHITLEPRRPTLIPDDITDSNHHQSNNDDDDQDDILFTMDDMDHMMDYSNNQNNNNNNNNNNGNNNNNNNDTDNDNDNSNDINEHNNGSIINHHINHQHHPHALSDSLPTTPIQHPISNSPPTHVIELEPSLVDNTSLRHAPTNTWGTRQTPDNPWSFQVYQRDLQKIQQHAKESSLLSTADDHVKKFILLEDLTDGVNYPCVLDLKMGTRQYGTDATPTKMRSQTLKCEQSTSKALGVRVCGMQVYNSKEDTFLFQDKYYGRTLTVDTFRDTLEGYLNNGNGCQIHYIPTILKRLRHIAKIIKSMHDYRFYTSSLLMIYDGDNNSKKEIDIRIIDFAHCVTQEEVTRHRAEFTYPPRHPGPDNGYLLGLKSLVSCFESIFLSNGGNINLIHLGDNHVFDDIGDYST
ncbi:unnamed protein product [Cunninghamella blakesleeana]